MEPKEAGTAVVIAVVAGGILVVGLCGVAAWYLVQALEAWG